MTKIAVMEQKQTSTSLPVQPNNWQSTPSAPGQVGDSSSDPNKGVFESPKPLIQAFGSAIAKFTGGLLLMGIAGLVIGLVFGQLAVAQTGYFSGLANTFSFMLALLPLTAIFGAVAFARRDFMWILYPIVAFGVAGSLAHADLVWFIYGNLSVHVSAASATGHSTAIVPVMLSYMMVFALERPIHYLRERTSQQDLRIYGGLLILSVVVMSMLSILSHPAYTAQQRARAEVQLPDTTQLTSVPVLNLESHKRSSLDFVRIIYQDATVQRDGAYQQVDTLRVQPLADWWQRDTRANCGARLVNPDNAAITAEYTYKQTKGVTYGEIVFTQNNSYPVVASAAYQEHYYCFVLGDQKYTLIRSEATGDQYLQKYPPTMVIDDIATAPAYLPLCMDRGAYASDNTIPKVSYCTAADTAKIDAHNTASQKRYTQTHSDIPVSPALPTPKTYQEVNRLAIKEWGVSFSLSTEIKDAYYVLDSDGEVRIGLNSYPSNACFAGARKDAQGRLIIGYGVATMVRQKTATLATSPGYNPADWIIVGNYSYGVSSNDTLCPDLFTQGQASLGYSLPDIFTWAHKSIH